MLACVVSERGPFQGLGYVSLHTKLRSSDDSETLTAHLQPHGSEFNGVFFGPGNDLADYIIQFAATLDPNGGSNRTINWPRYNNNSREVLNVLDGDVPLKMGNDSNRRAQTDKLAELTFKYPL